MFSQYLRNIDGVASYPLISLLIFIPFFVIVLLIVLTMKKEHAQYMSNLPLEGGNGPERRER